MKKNTLIKLVSLSLSILLLVWLMLSVGLFDSQEDKDPLRTPSLANTVLPVKAMIIKKAPLTVELIAGGSVMADEMVNVSAEIAEQVIKIHFEEGSTVQEGELLVTINNANLFAQIDQLVYQLYDLTEEEIKIVEGTN